MNVNDKRFLQLAAVLYALAMVAVSEVVCLRALAFDGILVPECPDGTPRLTLWAEARSLRRGTWGTVSCGARAHYTTGAADLALRAPVRRVDCDVALVDGKGTQTPLAPKEGWDSESFLASILDSSAHERWAEVKLPEVQDGDYLLRVKGRTPLGAATVDVPLAVYAPAKIHVLTDRPLYEPGNLVQFRAVLLRARDLAPLDGRPGSWVVKDPSGEVLLEEKSPAGAWGVAIGSFPLDRGATAGDWKIAYVSGDARDEVTIRVEPFTLPRFRVSGTPDRPWYRPGDRPVLRGEVRYSSGAPVSGAEVAIDWSVAGEWPAPPEWSEGGLPRTAIADAAGSFRLELPQVPGDLQGRVTLGASLTAKDAAGDRVGGGAALLLTEDGIQVSAVTELGDGLVESFNNRVYLRVTDPAGVVLPGAEVTVRRAWEPGDRGVTAKADEDGVAALQLDPGKPVNVVIPPPPFRPQPRPRAVTRSATHDLVGAGVSLADQTALDVRVASLDPCARFVEGGASAQVVLRVDRDGRVADAGHDDQPVSACIAAALKDVRLAVGPERVLQVSFGVIDPGLPRLAWNLTGVGTPEGLPEVVQRAALDARGCLPDTLASGDWPERLVWRSRAGSAELDVAWLPDPRAPRVPDGTLACVRQRIGRLSLPAAAKLARLGVLELDGIASPRVSAARPQATTMLGYELAVSARDAKGEVGTTKLRLRPGAVPPLRIRLTPVVVDAGGTVDVEVLRGPSYAGKVPERVWLRHEKGNVEGKLDPKTRAAKFTVPQGVRGWAEVAAGGASARLYVRSRSDLSVALKSDRPRYAPGETAKLELRTQVGGQGTSAAVTLLGVDESLSQLVSLPGPDELARMRPKPPSGGAAFGTLDPQALEMGRVRGSHAATAVVLRVSGVPPKGDIDSWVTGRAEQVFEPVEELTDRFYPVLSELHDQARTWEQQAPAGEVMQPATLTKLWDRSLGACEQRGEKVVDAYGRRMKLSRLPRDLLALTDPRAVVVDATRLPEDVESWDAWVAVEEP